MRVSSRHLSKSGLIRDQKIGSKSWAPRGQRGRDRVLSCCPKTVRTTEPRRRVSALWVTPPWRKPCWTRQVTLAATYSEIAINSTAQQRYIIDRFKRGSEDRPRSKLALTHQWDGLPHCAVFTRPFGVGQASEDGSGGMAERVSS